MIFNSVWSLIVLVYVGITPLWVENVFHKLVALGLLGITTLFWFAGSIALAARVGGLQCNGVTWCGTAQAAAAFGFFLWIAFTFLLVVDALAALHHHKHGATVDGQHNLAHNKHTEPAVAV